MLNIPSVPDVGQDPVAKIPQRSTVSEDLSRETEAELKKIKPFQPLAKLDIQKEEKPSEALLKSAPQQEVKAPAAKILDAKLKISGADGSSPYWARVQSIISSQWKPPPVGTSGQTYTVIVQFRLQRDGMIKNVVIKQTSGDFYVDTAGQRALRDSGVLPVFPVDITDGYKDVEMVFRVGESAG
jgi:outer membrane biosynthesis protein TonB